MVRARDVDRRLSNLGAVVVRQTGSPRLYRAGPCTTIVAQPAGVDIPVGTLRKIERDMEPCLGLGWLR